MLDNVAANFEISVLSLVHFTLVCLVGKVKALENLSAGF